jgi:hypothetical protein
MLGFFKSAANALINHSLGEASFMFVTRRSYLLVCDNQSAATQTTTMVFLFTYTPVHTAHGESCPGNVDVGCSAVDEQDGTCHKG